MLKNSNIQITIYKCAIKQKGRGLWFWELVSLKFKVSSEFCYRITNNKNLKGYSKMICHGLQHIKLILELKLSYQLHSINCQIVR